MEQAYRAYQLSIERNGSDSLKLPGMEQFSGDQLFFLAFAQVRIFSDEFSTYYCGVSHVSVAAIEQMALKSLINDWGLRALLQSWCSYVSPETLLDMVRSNEHSPPKFRVLGSCSNFPTFSDVWNCPDGTNMNPDHKCLLW